MCIGIRASRACHLYWVEPLNYASFHWLKASGSIPQRRPSSSSFGHKRTSRIWFVSEQGKLFAFDTKGNETMRARVVEAQHTQKCNTEKIIWARQIHDQNENCCKKMTRHQKFGFSLGMHQTIVTCSRHGVIEKMLFSLLLAKGLLLVWHVAKSLACDWRHMTLKSPRTFTSIKQNQFSRGAWRRGLGDSLLLSSVRHLRFATALLLWLCRLTAAQGKERGENFCSLIKLKLLGGFFLLDAELRCHFYSSCCSVGYICLQ